MKYSIILLMFFISGVLYAQDHDHGGHNHGDSLYEFGLSLGVANLIDEDEYAASAHVHILRKLSEDGILSHVSMGVGFEYIFAEHKHYSLVATISLNPVAALKLDVSPGILFSEHEGGEERLFVTHFEATYEFELEGFGIGPVIGYGVAGEDNHLMIGIHFGVGL